MGTASFVTVLAILLSGAEVPQGIFEELASARDCQPASHDSRQLNCRFRLKDLDFEIAGVGAPDAGILVYRSDFDGYYYAAFGRAHTCVVVKPGAKNPNGLFTIAFVSYLDGKAYKSIEDCRGVRSSANSGAAPHGVARGETASGSLDRECAFLAENRLAKSTSIRDEQTKTNSFYSKRLQTCVLTTEHRVLNDFKVLDVSREFIRQGGTDPTVFGFLFTCTVDGVNNVILTAVEKHRGYVWDVGYKDFMDDYAGGPPGTLKTPAKRPTRDECARLFRRKVEEVR